MQVRVETFVDEHGVEKLRRFHLGNREIEVVDNIDQWYGDDYRYFKVRAGDGSIYILRLDEARGEWDLTLFRRARPPGADAILGRLDRQERGVEM